MRYNKSIEELLIELNELERRGATAEELGLFVTKNIDYCIPLLKSIKLKELIPVKINIFGRIEEYFYSYVHKELIPKIHVPIYFGAPIKTDFLRAYDTKINSRTSNRT